MKEIFTIILIAIFASCKLQPESNREYDKYDPSRTYKLQMSPTVGSNYHYDVSNQTEMSLEVGEKEIENISKSDIGINYKIDKDSTGALLFTLQFEKIHLYSKNKDAEKDLDANNATMSNDPIEKMLGILKETKLQSTVTTTGETRLITGFKEIGDKIMAAFPATDENTKMGMEVQWNKTIGDNLIKKNMDQLFRLFPDSTVHLGDSWKLASKQEGEISYVIRNTFTLKAINSETAIIESHGIINSDQSTSNIAGAINAAVADLKGEQEGEYEIETKTGMLISSRIKANVTGTMNVIGREVPIKIKSSVKINGRKL